MNEFIEVVIEGKKTLVNVSAVTMFQAVDNGKMVVIYFNSYSRTADITLTALKKLLGLTKKR
jgi:hypothetical protein